MRFIIQHTHSQRFVPIICNNINSKSRDIRRHCCEFLDQLLHTWPNGCLERHVNVLGEAIKKGICKKFALKIGSVHPKYRLSFTTVVQFHEIFV